MERRVDLSKLPTKKYGTGTCIDWKKAVGQKIPFCYDNVRGELTIVEHQKENYNDKTILIVSHGAFIKCLHFAINGYDKNTDFLFFNPKNTTIYEYVIK